MTSIGYNAFGQSAVKAISVHSDFVTLGTGRNVFTFTCTSGALLSISGYVSHIGVDVYFKYPSLCSNGTYLSPESAGISSIQTCLPCLPGSYSHGGAISCKPCPAGSYTGRWSSFTCYECPEGHYCPEGATTYNICPAGIVATAGVDICTPCGEGNFSYPGTSTCLSCSST
jgi:hypothetical protein